MPTIIVIMTTVTSLAAIMTSGSLTSFSSPPIMLMMNNHNHSNINNPSEGILSSNSWNATIATNYSTMTLSPHQINNSNGPRLFKHFQQLSSNKTISSSSSFSNGFTSNNTATICIHRLCVRQNGHRQPSSGMEICYNDKGDMVKHGEQYIPLGIDTCTQCTCMHGRAEMCISVLCSPPENCRKYHEVTNKCCEFLCLDGGSSGPDTVSMVTNHHIVPNGINGGGLRFFNKTILAKGESKTFHSISTSNLGLRLITSTITSFLILALLLFMIHRLRQRRLIMMIRRLQNRRLEQLNSRHQSSASFHQEHSDHSAFSGYFGNPLGGSVNMLGSSTASLGGHLMPFGFGPFGLVEPPPPYTFWKPPSEQQPNGAMPASLPPPPPNEAPPSYEESVNNNPNMTIIGYNQNHHHHHHHTPHHLPVMLSASHSNQYSNQESHSIPLNEPLTTTVPSVMASNYRHQSPYPGRQISILTHHNNMLLNETNGIRMEINTASFDPQHTFTKQINSSSSNGDTGHINNNNLVRHNSVPITNSHQKPSLIYRGEQRQQQFSNYLGARQNLGNTLYYPQRLITHLASSLVTTNNDIDSSPYINNAVIMSSNGNNPAPGQHITVLRVSNDNLSCTNNMINQRREDSISDSSNMTGTKYFHQQQPNIHQNERFSTIYQNGRSSSTIIHDVKQPKYQVVREDSFKIKTSNTSNHATTMIVSDNPKQTVMNSDPLMNYNGVTSGNALVQTSSPSSSESSLESKYKVIKQVTSNDNHTLIHFIPSPSSYKRKPSKYDNPKNRNIKVNSSSSSTDCSVSSPSSLSSSSSSSSASTSPISVKVETISHL